MAVPYDESALLVALPEAEAAVGRFRAALDSSAALGVPAHVTVLYPFMPPGLITDEVMAELRRAFTTVPAFDVTLGSVGWFDNSVVYVHPSPAAPFRRLTSLVVERWPEWPPYGGRFGEPTPHLTIGDHGDPDDLRRAGEAVDAQLPIAAHVAEVQLYRRAQSWTWCASFPLGSAAP